MLSAKFQVKGSPARYRPTVFAPVQLTERKSQPCDPLVRCERSDNQPLGIAEGTGRKNRRARSQRTSSQAGPPSLCFTAIHPRGISLGGTFDHQRFRANRSGKRKSLVWCLSICRHGRRGRAHVMVSATVLKPSLGKMVRVISEPPIPYTKS